MTTRCEGWTRRGGAFTFGPVKWTQCESEAVVLLTVIQEGKTEDMPACMSCWNTGIGFGLEITKAVPLVDVDTPE